MGSEANVLEIAYLFPPLGGPGVQRSFTLAKYLPGFGYTPAVLTVKPILFFAYDQTLLPELPPEVEVARSGSLDPLRVGKVVRDLIKREKKTAAASKPELPKFDDKAVNIYRKVRDWILFPDAQIGWIAFAVAKGSALIRRSKIKIIYVSAAPPSGVIAAMILSRMYKVPYVLDFRDAWTRDWARTFPTKLHRRLDVWIERMAVKNATRITSVVPSISDGLVERYPEREKDISTIFNGFDPERLIGVKPLPRDPGRIRVVHCGSLYAWLRSGFRVVLTSLAAQPPEVRSRIELVIVGQRYGEIEQDIAEFGFADQASLKGYLPHPEALSYVKSADINLMILPNGLAETISGRVFDYIGAEKPILALVPPNGSCAEVLRSAGYTDCVVDQDDQAAVTALLGKLCAGEARLEVKDLESSPFNRKNQAKAFADLFNDVLKSR